MNEWLERAGKRFARLATRSTVARPRLWRVFRRPLRAQFERLAPIWEGRAGPEALVSLGAALQRLKTPPARVLDLGTGTGKAARIVARLFPEALIEAVDISPSMVEEARGLLPTELGDRVHFQVADASALPYREDHFDLVVLLNMIPFFEELARVTVPGGRLVVAFSWGADTPMYVPSETLRQRLTEVGYRDFEEVTAGQGTALLARFGATRRT